MQLCLFAEYGPFVSMQFFYKFRFAAAEIAVEKAMETLAVVHLGKMGDFVAYHIVAEVGGEEHQHIAQRDYAPAVALAENAVA